ncbi:hypothetical protein VPBG_00139 [Vibrio phage helene 12B3]|uniref:hypothetical protein n=1 Tax=Vibrio phage helene 12B3 TaxID=573173 RepID=UPI0002C04DB6|nr:hypothetical protein VPBG_00139 [Vibrio phage helene 12B3]AGG57911.1 hypothetical protein VPBG_00139 [Vibrio phage helene 12B3]
MKIKNIFVVEGLEFENESAARKYQEILEVGKAYRESAKLYQEVLNSCTCEELVFRDTVQRDYGKSYSDEWDNWHKDRIPVDRYSCKCCGKEWDYADYDGKGECWKHSGTILVKTGRF